MDTQDPPTDPAISLPGANRFRQRKRCYDVTLSRQEGSTTRHLASVQHWTGLAGGNTGRLFLTFGGPVCADRISYCPLDRVLTYKNLIYLLNLQFSCLKQYFSIKQYTKSNKNLISLIYVHFNFHTNQYWSLVPLFVVS